MVLLNKDSQLIITLSDLDEIIRMSIKYYIEEDGEKKAKARPMHDTKMTPKMIVREFNSASPGYKINERTVYDWAKRNRNPLPLNKITRPYWIYRSDLENWLEKTKKGVLKSKGIR